MIDKDRVREGERMLFLILFAGASAFVTIPIYGLLAYNTARGKYSWATFFEEGFVKRPGGGALLLIGLLSIVGLAGQYAGWWVIAKPV